MEATHEFDDNIDAAASVQEAVDDVDGVCTLCLYCKLAICAVCPCPTAVGPVLPVRLRFAMCVVCLCPCDLCCAPACLRFAMCASSVKTRILNSRVRLFPAIHRLV